MRRATILSAIAPAALVVVATAVRRSVAHAEPVLVRGWLAKGEYPGCAIVFVRSGGPTSPAAGRSPPRIAVSRCGRSSRCQGAAGTGRKDARAMSDGFLQLRDG